MTLRKWGLSSMLFLLAAAFVAAPFISAGEIAKEQPHRKKPALPAGALLQLGTNGIRHADPITWSLSAWMARRS